MSNLQDPIAKVLTPEWVCRVAGCNAVTLRAWRNRLGLFKPVREDANAPESKKWNRYSVLDACIVRLIVIMTEHGLPASEAVGLAWQHPLGPGLQLEMMLKGHDVNPFIGFHLGDGNAPTDRVYNLKTGEEYLAGERPPSTSSAMTAAPSDAIGDLVNSTQGVVTFVDLRTIIRHVTHQLSKSEVRKLVFGALAAGLKPDTEGGEQ